MIDQCLWKYFCALTLWLGMLTATTAQSLPGFTIAGENWSYNPGDGGGVITGILSKPSTNGPLPAILISHGKGGSAIGFALPKAREMTNWGAACIGPDYTHISNTNAPENEGWCPENSRRARACLTILKSLGYVDTNRIAAYGNSMGAFLTAGLCGAISNQIKVAAITAGGTSGTSDTDYAAPATQEVTEITAPFLMLHGATDTTVPPAQSATLQAILTSNGVPNDRIIFDGIGHDLHNNPATRDEVYERTHAWFTQWGLFGLPPAPTLVITSANAGTQFKLTWNRASVLTIIESSTNANGIFSPIGNVTNGFEYTVTAPTGSTAHGFYRLKQSD
jgi:dipeptidyl aminopeptidase/acylaminoacyl peptidase